MSSSQSASSSDFMQFFASVPAGMEDLLVTELQGLGATACAPTRAGVRFNGSLRVAYAACMWSRLASRILLPLTQYEAHDAEGLYEGARDVAWQEHFGARNTFAVDMVTRAAAVDHSHFGALKVKDAIVDHFRDRTGNRPNVDLDTPDVRITAYMHGAAVTLYLDLAGQSLHRRGYRRAGAAAPLKENLAAAILLRSGWPQAAAEGRPLLDPMCGSGTLLIEAASIAADAAPGLGRIRHGFEGWRQHDEDVWFDLKREALERQGAGSERVPPIFGRDIDPRMVRLAQEHVHRSGYADRIRLDVGDACCGKPPTGNPGVIVCNPPYGERLGTAADMMPLYARFGEALKGFFGWSAHIIVSERELGHSLGLRANKTHTLFNGALQCTLLHIALHAERADDAAPKGATMFANRLRKNHKRLSSWARQQNLTCYRVYDADLPEYAAAVDIYNDWVHVQEYEAPKDVNPGRAQARLRDILLTIPQVLNVPREQVELKVRKRQRGASQYERADNGGQFIVVQERDNQFWVNLRDYLDTGLFLDHRPARAWMQKVAADKDVLNLFAYTGAVTVAAARGGARSTTTVDMSNTYLDWAERNLLLNKLAGPQHHLVQADCLQWLRECDERFDIIFLDPPTFSNSKRMHDTLDVQRDHADLIAAAMKLLRKGGTLLFSTNARRFKMDASVGETFTVEDISTRSIDRDFERNPRIHRCYLVRRKDEAAQKPMRRVSQLTSPHVGP